MGAYIPPCGDVTGGVVIRVELEYVKVYPQTKIVTKGYSIEPKRWGFGVAVGPSVLVAPSGRVNAGLGVTGGFYLRL